MTQTLQEAVDSALANVAELKQNVFNVRESIKQLDQDIATTEDQLATGDSAPQKMLGAATKLVSLRDKKAAFQSVETSFCQRLILAERVAHRVVMLSKRALVQEQHDLRVEYAKRIEAMLPDLVECIAGIGQCIERAHAIVPLDDKIMSTTGWLINELAHGSISDTAPMILNNCLTTLAGKENWPFGEISSVELLKTMDDQRTRYMAFFDAATVEVLA